MGNRDDARLVEIGGWLLQRPLDILGQAAQQRARTSTPFFVLGRIPGVVWEWIGGHDGRGVPAEHQWWGRGLPVGPSTGDGRTFASHFQGPTAETASAHLVTGGPSKGARPPNNLPLHKPFTWSAPCRSTCVGDDVER